VIACRILGTGSALPSRRVTTDELLPIAFPGRDPVDLRGKVGITARYWLGEGDSATSLCVAALRRALDMARMDASQLERILFVTQTGGDWGIPANANHIAAALDISDTYDAFDLNNTCTGFLTGLDLAARCVATGTGPVAVVAVETFSRNLSPREPRAMLVFADGAAACIVGASPRADRGLAAVHLRNNAVLRGRILHAHPQPGMYYQFAPSGKELADAAISCIRHASWSVMRQAAVTPREVDRFLPHQPNGPLFAAIADAVGFGPDKLFPVVDEVGSLGAASAPYSLDQAIRAGNVQPGMSLLLAAVGSGTSYGAALVQTDEADAW
jgi:3-oxoacyl-(acyl-carrier-protein) synthase III